jgi:LemA protein
MATFYVILAVVVIVVLWTIGLYNGLIRLKNRTTEAWSDIDVQLKRRREICGYQVLKKCLM